MRRFLFLLLAVTGFTPAGHAQTANPSAPFTSPQAKQIYLTTHSNLPLERYEVAYYTTDPNGGSLAPAYIDLGTMTAYRWTGVVLQPDQIPSYFTNHPNGGSGLIFPQDPSKSSLQFKDVDPPPFYMLLPDGKYAEGFFDNAHSAFYRWGDLEFDKSQLPADAVSKNRVLPLQSATISTIAPPSPNAPKSSGTAMPTNPSEQTSPSISDQALPANPTPIVPATTTPPAQVQPAVETGTPWWIYAIIMLSIMLLVGAGYLLRNRK